MYEKRGRGWAHKGLFSFLLFCYEEKHTECQRKRQRQRDTGTQSQRQADRHTDRRQAQKESETGRQTDRPTGTVTDIVTVYRNKRLRDRDKDRDRQYPQRPRTQLWDYFTDKLLLLPKPLLLEDCIHYGHRTGGTTLCSSYEFKVS